MRNMNARPVRSRQDYIRQIEDTLGRRKLYWFGPRGADGRALLAIDQFDGCFSIMAPLEAVSVGRDVCLETLTRERVDHNTYSFDEDRSDALREFRAALLDALREPVAIVPYRPNRFLSNICFPRMETTLHLGLFHEHQSPFEHKPWVESELRKIGVRTLPWVYFADEDLPRLYDYLEGAGPLVLRASRSDGGARVELVTTREELDRLIPKHDDGFVCACHYFEDAVSLNLNGCVFRDGGITLHGLSEQVIGHPQLTRRRFGYCGNVFDGSTRFARDVVEQFEKTAQLVGAWLHSRGYLGAFGIDALWAEGRLFFVEVNPRFQGSSWAAARMDREMDQPDLYLSHLGAFLGLPAPGEATLAERVAAQRPMTLALIHNAAGSAIRLDLLVDAAPPAEVDIDLAPRNDVDVAPEAIVARMLVMNGKGLGSAGVAHVISRLRGLPIQRSLLGDARV